jgi:hypothetical protein
MPLLTRDERRQLSRQERRALRKQRRAEKRESGDSKPLLNIDLPKLRRRAAELILDMAGEVIPGESKMEEVLDALAEDLDELLVWSWAGPVAVPLEVLDGLIAAGVINALLRPHVQDLYDHLEDAGIIDAEGAENAG